MLKTYKRRALSVIFTLALVISLFSGLTINAAAIGGGTTINSGGTYQLDTNATGTITVATTAAVTIVGNGDGTASGLGTPNNELTIDCTSAGANLTIQNVYIKNTGTDGAVGINAINFTGTGNTLNLSGVSLIEGMIYTQRALIHVGSGAGLTINGSGTLYMYKYTQGAGIGGNATEANGAITIAGGNLLIKGSKTGALIGNDLCTASVTTGNITISGGNINLISKAQGAAIGGSRMSGAGNVYLTGGNLSIVTDFSGSSIGGGAQVKGTSGANGSIYITGGSLKTMITDNAYSSWGYPDTSDVKVTVTGDYYVINNATVTATKLSTGTTAVHQVLIDTVELDTPASSFTVYSGATLLYSGGLHLYDYNESASSTVANWDYTVEDDTNLYLYLPDGSYTFSVNGETYTATVSGSDTVASHS
jgi:hypothetical protein